MSQRSQWQSSEMRSVAGLTAMCRRTGRLKRFWKPGQCPQAFIALWKCKAQAFKTLQPRAENSKLSGHGNPGRKGRICTQIQVRQWQQYQPGPDLQSDRAFGLALGKKLVIYPNNCWEASPDIGSKLLVDFSLVRKSIRGLRAPLLTFTPLKAGASGIKF